MAEPSETARQIARGQNPEWEQTFEHPVHGSLPFRGRLPVAADLLAHRIEIDNRLEGLQGSPSTSTMILVSAMAGMTPVDPDTPGKGLLLDLPVVKEDRVEDDERGSVRIERVFYDADSELDIGFLTDVWMSYSTWRANLLQEVEAVKGSSGETSGNGSSESSSDRSVSPSTTPA